MLLGRGRIAAVGLLLSLSGCSITLTSRVDDDLTGKALGKDGKGVALLSAGVQGEPCRQIYVALGVREKDGFRHYRGLMIQRAKAPVAEVKLDPGEYHVIAFACANRGHTAKLGEGVNDGGFYPLYKKTFARFTVQPGEIVNIGFLQLKYLGETPSAFTKTIHADVTVIEWPRADLDVFREQRPGLAAQMKTRLMVASPPEPVTREQIGARCAEIRKLHAEGKIQNLPPGCRAPAGRPKASGMARNGGAPA
jgi:hypothetical protein